MKKLHYLYCILVLGFILGIQDGYVALWKDGNKEPMKVFPYRAAMLPQKDQAALKQGIPIDEDTDLARLLEDFLS